jgi:hypothetical protein
MFAVTIQRNYDVLMDYVIDQSPAFNLGVCEYNQGREEKMSKVPRALGAAMLCLGLLLSASFVMAKQDQAMPAKDQPKKEQKTKTTTLNGTVSAVTDSALTIVDSQKAEHTLGVTSETRVTKGGKDAALADVKANDVVTIEAQKGEDGTWMALRISVA